MEGVRGAFRLSIRVLDKHVIVQLGGVDALQVVVHQVARLCPFIRPFPLHAQFVREQVKSSTRDKLDIQSRLLNPELTGSSLESRESAWHRHHSNHEDCPPAY